MSGVAVSGRNRRSWLPVLIAWLAAVGALASAGAVTIGAANRAGLPVTVTVDGQGEALRSTRPNVEALLSDLGLTLRAEDRLEPEPNTPLRAGLVVEIVRARPGLVSSDGMLHEVYTLAGTVGGMVAAAGVHLSPNDEILLDGEPVLAGSPLPQQTHEQGGARRDWGRAWAGSEPSPVHLTVRRAVPIVVDDGSVPFTIYTTAPTVGEALLREAITLYLGDRVQPGLGTAVAAGLRVHIERSKPVQVSVDGRTVQTRTRGKTVGGVLMELGLQVAGSDRVAPALAEPVVDHLSISITRVTEATLVQLKPIPYEAIMVPDDNLDLDQQRLAQAGEDGEFRQRWKTVYENGLEVSRLLMDEWVAVPPVTRIVAYGRKIITNTLETPDGPVVYWRKIRMYATSYSPARAGTPITAPWYGRTRIGLRLRKGIVAVDPKLIPLQSWVYVPGYGKAIAGDTGGGVRGKWIDMGYEDHDYVSWHWWTDVYVLYPPPAADRIMWVLPNYPPPDFPRRR